MLPKWIKTLIILLIVISFASIIIKICCNIDYLNDISNFALVLSLAALIAYAYYNYLIAKDTYTPSASFALQPYKGDPYHFAFILQNHSKTSLNCWCKLNPTVYDQNIELDKFYGAKTSFDLQPFGNAMGNFDIRDILQKANRSLEEMQSKYTKDDVKKQLYFDIEFWYNPVGIGHKVSNPKQPQKNDIRPRGNYSRPDRNDSRTLGNGIPPRGNDIRPGGNDIRPGRNGCRPAENDIRP